MGIQTGLILVPAGTNQSTGNHLKANINFHGSVVNNLCINFQYFFYQQRNSFNFDRVVWRSLRYVELWSCLAFDWVKLALSLFRLKECDFFSKTILPLESLKHSFIFIAVSPYSPLQTRTPFYTFPMFSCTQGVTTQWRLPTGSLSVELY